MLTSLAQSIYNAYLAELRAPAGGSRSRKRRLRKLRRFLLKWADPDILVNLDNFEFMTPFSSNILLTHFEFPFYDTVLPRLARAVRGFYGRLQMVDVGANVGAATYLVSREATGGFYCIEANPRFKSSLTHNLAQIQDSRARFVALTDVRKQGMVRHHYADGNSNIESANADGEPLDFITLDEALNGDAPGQAPNLIKIDTEGFEAKILRGAQTTIQASQPVLFFEFFPAFIRREGDDPDRLFEWLGNQGYDRFLFYDGAGCLLTTVGQHASEELRALRRYCDLKNSFFDVAAFHVSASTLAKAFEASEITFYERSLHGAARANHVP